MSFVRQNAEMATNKRDELTVMCEELSLDVLVVTEHGFYTATSINSKFKITSWPIISTDPSQRVEEWPSLGKMIFLFFLTD